MESSTLLIDVAVYFLTICVKCNKNRRAGLTKKKKKKSSVEQIKVVAISHIERHKLMPEMFDYSGACEGTLACSTCHLIFTQAQFDDIPEKATDEELDMLDWPTSWKTRKMLTLLSLNILLFVTNGLDMTKKPPKPSPFFTTKKSCCPQW